MHVEPTVINQDMTVGAGESMGFIRGNIQCPPVIAPRPSTVSGEPRESLGGVSPHFK